MKSLYICTFICTYKDNIFIQISRFFHVLKIKKNTFLKYIVTFYVFPNITLYLIIAQSKFLTRLSCLLFYDFVHIKQYLYFLISFGTM